MDRTCTACGKTFTAKRSTAKYCSSSCRANVSTGKVVPLNPGAPIASHPASTGSLSDATSTQLADAGRADTPVGVAALLLARQLDDPTTPPAARAGLTREFRSTLAEALKGATAGSAVDDLRARRDARRTG